MKYLKIFYKNTFSSTYKINKINKMLYLTEYLDYKTYIKKSTNHPSNVDPLLL